MSEDALSRNRGIISNLFDATDNQSSAQTDTALVSAPGAGLSLFITDLIISNGATAGSVKIVENTASSTDVIELMYFAINGGMTKHFDPPLQISENVDVGYTSATVTTHSVFISGFKALSSDLP